MIWPLLHVIAAPDHYEATFANGEVFVREVEQQTAIKYPAVALDGEWFDHPDCRVPIEMEDEVPGLEAAE